MNSRIYVGDLLHARLHPVRHQFRYPIYFYVFDLEELPLLHRSLAGFSYNRLNLVAVHDRDYLTEGLGTIRDKLGGWLNAHGVSAPVHQVLLVTSARFCNYVFNPVSFYYCFGPDGEPVCAVAEVNNTFGDKHLYVLDRPLSSPGEFPLRYQHPKTFHVSPFNDMAGEYAFCFSGVGDDLSIHVDLYKEGRPWMVTELRGQARPLTSASLMRTVARYPFTAALTMPRILTQAAQLYVRRRLATHRRPVPADPATVRAGPTRTPAS